MGLDHPLGQQPGGSVMNQGAPCPNGAPNDACNNSPTDIKPCDNTAVHDIYYDPPPPGCVDGDGDGFGVGSDCHFIDCDDSNPDYTFNCSGGSGSCDAQAEADCFGWYGMSWDPATCRCYCDTTTGCSTPILIDVEGDGFALTGVEGGRPLRPQPRRGGGATVVDGGRRGRRVARRRPER